MKRELTVRQNRCDREQHFLLFLCLILYFSMQLVSRDNPSSLANICNLLLYLIFAPGFLFAAGYNFGRLTDEKDKKERGQEMLFMAGKYFLCYLLISAGFYIVTGELDQPIIRIFTELLSLTAMPAPGAVFLTLALLWLFVRSFGEKLYSWFLRHKKAAVAVFVLLVLSSMIRISGDAYVLSSLFVGVENLQSVPLLPYFAFFMLGVYFWREKPGFQLKPAVIALIISAVSLLLYQTALRPLARVTLSFLPVYLLYCLAELISDLCLRARAVKFICDIAEPVFLVCAFLLLFAAGYFSIVGGTGTALFIAAGLVIAVYLGIFAFFTGSELLEKARLFLRGHVKHKMPVYYLLYTLIFAGLALLVFFPFLSGGASLIYRGDGAYQYYPKAIYFVRYVKEIFSSLLSGNLTVPMYDFSNALGSDISISYEPVYFLYLLFGEDHMEFAYSFLTVLRIYLAGISMSIFCRYFKKSYACSLLASIIYVFCGWTLFGGTKHPMFLIPVILLPLLILSMEEIIRKKRWWLCTIFVAVSLFSNYYYLYMDTIAMGIYFVVRFLTQKDRAQRTLKNFFKRGLVIVGSYLLGVGIACITLVTKFGMYLSSGRGDSVVIKVSSMLFYRVGWLVNCFLTFITTATSPGEWLTFGFLPIALLAVVFLFVRKGRKELKIFSVIALIFCAFPIFGFIFSGFSSIINRWCYMLALLAAYIVADCFPAMHRLKRKDKIAFSAVIALYGILSFCGQYSNNIYTHVAFITLLATFVVLIICQDSVKIRHCYKQGLTVCLTAALVFWQGYSLYHHSGYEEEFLRQGTAYETATNTPLLAMEEIDDDSFYRAAPTTLDFYTSNAPILLDENSLSMISSTINGSVLEYYREMGATSFNEVSLRGMSNVAFMDNLAAVKYFASFDETNNHSVQAGCEPVLETKVNGEDVTVYENEYALPIGYTYSEAISEEELENYDTEARREVLMQKVMLSDGESDGTSDITLSGKELEITSVREKNASLTEHGLAGVPDESGEEGSHKVTLSFEGEPNAETYLVLHNANLEGDMSEESVHLTIKAGDDKVSYNFMADDDRYRTGQSDYVFNLGYHEEAIDSVTIRIREEREITFDGLSIYAQSMDNLPAYTEALTEDVLEDVKLGTDTVSGTISLDEEKYLVLSIPYQGGWTAYVDGEKTDILRANYMYMALDLEPGTHTIELDFEIPGLRYAAVIMPSSLGIFIAACIISYIYKRHKRKKRMIEQKQE